MDWFLYYFDGVLYLTNPINLYKELIGNPKIEVLDIEIAIGSFSFLIPIAILAFSLIMIMIQVVISLLNLFQGSHIKFIVDWVF